jgi:uncharacterized phiE125 gp8 family phage protein
VDIGDEDALIAALGVAAREYCERQTGFIIAGRQFKFEAAGFPSGAGDIVLPLGPIAVVSQVAWYACNGNGLTVGVVDTDFRLTPELCRVRLMPTVTEWPCTRAVTDAVQITATVGNTNVNAIPQVAKHAIRLLVGHWFQNREGVVNGTISSDVKMTVDALLSSLKVREMMG